MREPSRCGQEHTDTDELLCLGTANDSPHFQHKDRCTGQAASHVPSAAAHFVFAEDVQLTNISVRHVGGWGVWFGAGCRDCALRHSTVTDTGAGGARVGAAPGEAPSTAEDAAGASSAKAVRQRVLVDGAVGMHLLHGLQLALGVHAPHGGVAEPVRRAVLRVDGGRAREG